MILRSVLRTAAREYGLSLLFVLLALGVWEILVRAFQVADYVLPPPSQILSRVVTARYTLLGHAWVTLQEALLGFVLGATAGTLFAIAMARSRVVERMLYPLVISSQTFPKEALAPVFLMWFGFGIFPKVIIAGLISFFPVVINTTRGLLTVDPLILDLMRALSASQRQVFLKVRLPNAIPYQFAALKICITLSVIGAVVGEFVGASAGLGHLIRLSNSELATDLMFAALIVLGMMGTLLFLIVEGMERRLMRRWGGVPEAVGR
ncbi:MAG: ABC transporter permease [Candidatus Latescibacteria bacterium]|nr:ABC transporter permease [Candidatus Latescibacterota bacterium]